MKKAVVSQFANDWDAGILNFNIIKEVENMKRILKLFFTVIFTIIAVFFVVIVVSLLFNRIKTHYLALEYLDLNSQKKEITKVEIAGIYLKGHDYGQSEYEKQLLKTEITDKKKINMLTEYLESIPLKYVKESEDFDSTGGCCILFYSSNTMCEGLIEINGNSFIHNSSNVAIYRPKDKGRDILSEIKELGL